MTDAIYDVCKLVEETGRALMQQACVTDALSHLGTLEQSLSKDLTALRQEWSTLQFSLERGDRQAASIDSLLAEHGHTLSGTTAQLMAAITKLAEAGAEDGLGSRFAATKDGQLLTKAWKAILDGDTGMLSTMTGYAPNNINSGSRIVYRLFSQLIEQAGIKFALGGWGGGAFQGERHGSFVFMIEARTGLRVAYDHVFDHEKKIDSKTFTAAVVQGSIDGQGEFKMVGEPNQEPAAVKAMAATIGQKLRDHYQKEGNG